MPNRDPAKDILQDAAISNRLKATLWDAFHQSGDRSDLEARLEGVTAPAFLKMALANEKGEPQRTEPQRTADLPAASGQETGILDTILDLLSPAGGMALGTIGGLTAGPPGALTGAALGGAGGQGAENLVRTLMDLNPPETMTEGVPGAAAREAAFEGAGGLASRGVRAVGRNLLRRGVNPPANLQRNFKDLDILGVLERERLPVGRSATMAARRGAASRSTSRSVAEATRRGVRVPAEEIAQEANNRLGTELVQQGLQPDAPDFARLEQLTQEWIQAHKSKLTPGEVRNLTKAAQRAAKALFRKEGAEGTAQGAQLPARFEQEIAKAGRRRLVRDVPGAERGLERTRELVAGTRALEEAELRNPAALFGEFGFMRALAGGAFGFATTEDIGSAALSAALFGAGVSPKLLSKVGLSLSNPIVQTTLRQAPRTLGTIAAQASRSREQ